MIIIENPAHLPIIHIVSLRGGKSSKEKTNLRLVTDN